MREGERADLATQPRTTHVVRAEAARQKVRFDAACVAIGGASYGERHQLKIGAEHFRQVEVRAAHDDVYLNVGTHYVILRVKLYATHKLMKPSRGWERCD